uniref:Uncharacterized protein n=1 Tax=Geladintestivirus 1 TaxID=3233133 RepID=A0AAU8MIC3_9CAUD
MTTTTMTEVMKQFKTMDAKEQGLMLQQILDMTKFEPAVRCLRYEGNVICNSIEEATEIASAAIAEGIEINTIYPILEKSSMCLNDRIVEISEPVRYIVSVQ